MAHLGECPQRAGGTVEEGKGRLREPEEGAEACEVLSSGHERRLNQKLTAAGDPCLRLTRESNNRISRVDGEAALEALSLTDGLLATDGCQKRKGSHFSLGL